MNPNIIILEVGSLPGYRYKLIRCCWGVGSFFDELLFFDFLPLLWGLDDEFSTAISDSGTVPI